jgi:hypothetical protein
MRLIDSVSDPDQHSFSTWIRICILYADPDPESKIKVIKRILYTDI